MAQFGLLLGACVLLLAVPLRSEAVPSCGPLCIRAALKRCISLGGWDRCFSSRQTPNPSEKCCWFDSAGNNPFAPHTALESKPAAACERGR